MGILIKGQLINATNIKKISISSETYCCKDYDLTTYYIFVDYLDGGYEIYNYENNEKEGDEEYKNIKKALLGKRK